MFLNKSIVVALALFLASASTSAKNEVVDPTPLIVPKPCFVKVEGRSSNQYINAYMILRIAVYSDEVYIYSGNSYVLVPTKDPEQTVQKFLSVVEAKCK